MKKAMNSWGASQQGPSWQGRKTHGSEDGHSSEGEPMSSKEGQFAVGQQPDGAQSIEQELHAGCAGGDQQDEDQQA